MPNRRKYGPEVLRGLNRWGGEAIPLARGSLMGAGLDLTEVESLRRDLDEVICEQSITSASLDDWEATVTRHWAGYLGAGCCCDADPKTGPRHRLYRIHERARRELTGSG
jgi:hypothetical protein